MKQDKAARARGHIDRAASERTTQQSQSDNQNAQSKVVERRRETNVLALSDGDTVDASDRLQTQLGQGLASLLLSAVDLLASLLGSLLLVLLALLLELRELVRILVLLDDCRLLCGLLLGLGLDLLDFCHVQLCWILTCATSKGRKMAAQNTANQKRGQNEKQQARAKHAARTIRSKKQRFETNLPFGWNLR